MTKSESYKIVKRIFEKHAGATSDALGALASGGALGLFSNGIANSDFDSEQAKVLQYGLKLPLWLGSIGGLLSETPSIEDIHELDANPNESIVPGVGISRLLRRRRAVRNQLRDKPGSNGVDMPVSELTGPLSAYYAPVIAGAGIGKLMGSAGTGTSIGMGIGAGGTALGALLAGLTPRRTLEEQARVENSKIRPWLRHIVPGLSVYDTLKAIGASKHLSGDIDTVKEEIARIRENRRMEEEDAE